MSAKFNVSYPNVIDFKNNLLSWIGEEKAQRLMININDLVPLWSADQRLFKRVIRHSHDDMLEKVDDKVYEMIQQILCNMLQSSNIDVIKNNLSEEL